MNNYVYDMLKYIYNITCNLASPYHNQFQNMEDFARWNLPDEIGLEWIDARDTRKISQLHEFSVIPYDAVVLLHRIVQRFDDAFDLPEAERDKVYSHQAMQNSAFWSTQRQDAQMLIPILQKALDSMQV